MEEGVLLEADIHEHRLQAVLDVFDAAFEDGADDVAVALALDGVLLEHAVFEQGDAALEPLGVDDELVTGLARGQANQAFDAIGHGKKFWVKFGKHRWERRFAAESAWVRSWKWRSGQPRRWREISYTLARQSGICDRMQARCAGAEAGFPSAAGQCALVVARNDCSGARDCARRGRCRCAGPRRMPKKRSNRLRRSGASGAAPTCWTRPRASALGRISGLALAVVVAHLDLARALRAWSRRTFLLLRLHGDGAVFCNRGGLQSEAKG